METYVVLAAIAALCSSTLMPALVRAEVLSTTTYGTPGLIDMPTAQSAPDAELSSTLSYTPNALRTTLSFQIAPRLSGSFRYSLVEGILNSGTLYDRSFDLRYRLTNEGRYRPAIAIGLQDFIGTGIYSGEYIVATKTLTSNLTFSGGIGWGRFGSYNGFTNPLGKIDPRFNSRGTKFTGTGGIVEAGKWFRGGAAFFGGVIWKVTPKLTLKAEYSSDAYTREVRGNAHQHQTPFNFGLDYTVARGVNLQAYFLNGSEIGAAMTFALNPKQPSIVGGLDKAPQPVRLRLPQNIANLGWTDIPNANANLRKAASELLAKEGLVLEAMSVRPTATTIRIRNSRYNASAQAIGRTARILSRVMPDSVETFEIIPIVQGIAVSSVTVKRSDIEALENDPDGSQLSLERAKFADPVGRRDEALVYGEGLYPRFQWSIGPYVSTSFFDPDSPIRAELGLEANASYEIRPGLTLSGAIRKRAVGNKHTATRVSDSLIRRVRSDSNIYDREGDPAITHLTLAHSFRPGKDLYGRLTVGYLEKMYGGVSGELLWKPVDSRFALGVELNYVKQRNFDQLFGFQPYGVATGHLTAYWDMGNGYFAQGSVGRYLGGDLGGTVKLERIFKNGWRIGAYTTLTDVPFNQFGEGSFDKGLTFTVPLDHFVGTPKRQILSTVLQPLSRDGGAQLDVKGRLYEAVRGYHKPSVADSWGRFWR